MTAETKAARLTISLVGWTHVHTWQESHGNYSTAIYQRDIDESRPWERRVELLEISTYHDSMYGSADRQTGVRIDAGKFAHDYLLAREIRANPDRYQRIGDRAVTPCYTAGHDEFEDTRNGRFYRVFGAAGHGEWAFEIQPNEVGARGD